MKIITDEIIMENSKAIHLVFRITIKENSSTKSISELKNLKKRKGKYYGKKI